MPNSVLFIETKPEATPETKPEAMTEATPEAIPPKAIPEAIPEANPEATPEVTYEIIAEFYSVRDSFHSFSQASGTLYRDQRSSGNSPILVSLRPQTVHDRLNSNSGSGLNPQPKVTTPRQSMLSH